MLTYVLTSYHGNGFTTIAKGLLVCAAFLIGAPLFAENETDNQGRVERITIHSKALTGNLEGNTADRDVFVYLPPGYDRDSNKRFPVIYNLHGYTVTAESWSRFLNWPESPNQAFANAANREMIIVMPDAMTAHGGSMYSSSVTTGDWEGFIVNDLISYIDDHYRTLANRESRGLAGHSMGGYGTVRLAMKYPETFSAFYAMSSCCMAPRKFNDTGFRGAGTEGIEDIKTLEQARQAGMGIRSTLAVASAWAPNPNNPPLYVDLPVKNGEVQDLVIAKWAANAPLVMVHQYVPNLRRYHAIGIEIGLQDGGLNDSQDLDKILTDYGIAHQFETYEGNHTNKIRERFATKLIPFFSQYLTH